MYTKFILTRKSAGQLTGPICLAKTIEVQPQVFLLQRLVCDARLHLDLRMCDEFLITEYLHAILLACDILQTIVSEASTCQGISVSVNLASFVMHL